MSERGVFAVDRGIFGHPLFEEGREFSRREAWLWLLAEAEWRPATRARSGAKVALKRGQLAHSIRFMADAWGWHRAKVERFLDRLKTETMIETHAETGVTVITICKYDQYQRVSLPDRDADVAPAETAPRQQRDKLEDREYREDSPSLRSGDARAALDAEFAQFWAGYPNKVGKPAAAKAFAKARKRADQPTILAGLARYRAKADDRQWCNPATWLNQDRWADQPATVAPVSRGPPRQGNGYAALASRLLREQTDDPAHPPDDDPADDHAGPTLDLWPAGAGDA